LSLAIPEFSSLPHVNSTPNRCDRKVGGNNQPERSIHIPTGLSMTPHTLLKQRKYLLPDLNPIYMPSHVYGITKRILLITFIS
jgi:hypothetical protein